MDFEYGFNRKTGRLLDRITNGDKLAKDTRNVMAELQSIVAEIQSAQVAFGTTGAYSLVQRFGISCVINNVTVRSFELQVLCTFLVLKEREHILTS